MLGDLSHFLFGVFDLYFGSPGSLVICYIFAGSLFRRRGQRSAVFERTLPDLWTPRPACGRFFYWGIVFRPACGRLFYWCIFFRPACGRLFHWSIFFVRPAAGQIFFFSGQACGRRRDHLKILGGGWSVLHFFVLSGQACGTDKSLPRDPRICAKFLSNFWALARQPLVICCDDLLEAFGL